MDPASSALLAKHTQALQQGQLALQDNVIAVTQAVKDVSETMKAVWTETNHRMQAQEERSAAVEERQAAVEKKVESLDSKLDQVLSALAGAGGIIINAAPTVLAGAGAGASGSGQPAAGPMPRTQPTHKRKRVTAPVGGGGASNNDKIFGFTLGTTRYQAPNFPRSHLDELKTALAAVVDFEGPSVHASQKMLKSAGIDPEEYPSKLSGGRRTYMTSHQLLKDIALAEWE